MHHTEKVIIANWKMNGNKIFTEQYLQELLPWSSPYTSVICPPFPYLETVGTHLKNITGLYLGAQNCATHPHGAFTGEVSAEMLADMGVRYVLLGHSERRQYMHETAENIIEKGRQCLAQGLTPIICIGESAQAYAQKESRAFLTHQLHELQELIHEPIILAYEPIWAIGTGTLPSCKEIVQIHEHIKNLVRVDMQVLYGGSVTPDIAPDILTQNAVDGVLVGGASLKPETFRQIASPAHDA